MNTVEFTPDTAKAFVKAYNKARRSGSESSSFWFDNNQYVVSYAYYVIQYLVQKHLITGEFDKHKIFTTK